MTLIDGVLLELEQETQTTRRVLERVPNDQLASKPLIRLASPHHFGVLLRESRLGWLEGRDGIS